MDSKRVELEYQSISEGNQWNLVYQGIGQRCQSYTYTFNEAKKTENKPLNRYRDVNPFDHSRVVILKKNFFTDYINANLVKMDRANRQYILTQGPLVYTSGHFWLMVWEQNSPAIIMLNKIIEKSEIKCHWYWPHEDGDGHKVVYPDVNMSITQIKEYDYSYYTIRKLKMTYEETNESREIWHFHYTTWPDFEVPQSPHAFLNFLQRVRDYGSLDCAGDKGPAVVHCSAGIGRSGTFCLVDSVLVLIENEGQADVDVQEILLEMRRYRMGLIQTAEQLRFSYLAIVEGIKRLNPDYVPPETITESVYSAVAEEDEAPPPPPPRGESLGCPPKRPLPAIPASVSMEELNLYARRRARPGFTDPPAFMETGGVPSLVCLARDAYVAIDMPQVQDEQTLDVATAVPAVEADADTMTAAKQLDQCYDVANQIDDETDGETDDSHSEERTFESISEEDSTFIFDSEDAPDISDMSIHMLEHSSSEETGVDMTITSTASEIELSNIDVSSNLESDDSDAPPIPLPRDQPADQAADETADEPTDQAADEPTDQAADQLLETSRDTPSPASSAYADEEIGDNDDTSAEITESFETSSEIADTVQSAVHVLDATGDGIRKRRALAERVASIKKRSHDADKWHSFKRSLVKPLAFSVGILAVGIIIYAYTKH